MNIDNQDSEKKLIMPPAFKSFQVTRMGLPLNWSDNLKSGMVLALTAALQIRLQSTILAEGWIIFFGLIGYLMMRYWLLRLRYPDVGEIELKENEIAFPGCLDQGKAKQFSFSDISDIVIYTWKGRSSIVLSSVEIFTRVDRVKLNWLALDLAEFEREVTARGLPCRREMWNPNLIVAAVLFVVMTVLLGAFLVREFWH